MEDNTSLVAMVKDLKAQNDEQKARLDRQEKMVKARLDGQDSKDLELIKKVSALEHKYVAVAGVTEVLKTNQLETDKWLLQSMSRKPSRYQDNFLRVTEPGN